MSKKVMIELKDVWRTYFLGNNRLDVLKGVNLQVKQGEFVAIIGPSGSGKSTMMNQVGILDRPSQGIVYLEGHDISKYNDSELAQIRGKKIGFIFQQFNLIPTLTALENVTLPMMFQDVPEEKRIKRGESLLRSVELGDRMEHSPQELSGGQQQRVAIARALVNNPDIILADEPTGNLDSHSGQQIMDMLRDFHKHEGKTIILITHDIHLVKYADKVVHLKDGVIEKLEHNGIHR